MSRRSVLRFLGVALALAVVACGSQTTTVVHFRVPDAAMEPTIKTGSVVSVDLASRTPHLGDIVVFHPPTGAESADPVCGNPNQGLGHTAPCGVPVPHKSTATYVKRVVGLPGDRIAIVDGHVVRNGTKESEPYVEPCGAAPECNLPKAITVPPGDYFVLGDNRGVSEDSRSWGPVPRAWIVGTVVRRR